jgi:hypothetical protein
VANGGGYGGSDAARWGKNAKIAKNTAEVDGFARGRVETGVFGMASGSGRRLLQFAGERNDSRSRIQTEHVAVGGVKRIRAISKRRIGESFKGERAITFAEGETFLNSTRDVLEEVRRCVEVCNGWIAGETGKGVDSVSNVMSRVLKPLKDAASSSVLIVIMSYAVVFGSEETERESGGDRNAVGETEAREGGASDVGSLAQEHIAVSERS